MSSQNTSSSSGSGSGSSGRTSSVVTNHGTNNEGNHWCTRESGPSDTNSNPYHYSNRDGSYYYSNSDGSKYYNDGQGNAQYTPGK